MNDATELAALKFFANGRPVAWVAKTLRADEAEIRAVADDHGALDANGRISRTVAQDAADALLARINRDAAALPTRAAPAPVRAVPDASGEQVLRQIPLDRLRTDPTNPREDVGDVTELAASMAASDLLQPIVARRTAAGQLIVVAGHRRLAAARELGWKSIATIVRADMRPDEVLAAMLIENGQRRDLDPIEEARGLARLKGELGCSETVLARRIGRHQNHVSARLRLLALPIEEQEQIRRGDMTLTEARDRARIASGRIGAQTGRPGPGHFNTVHPLAAAAKARCLRLKHNRGTGQGVGGIACGACWESVIRADERSHLHERSGATGACVLCSTPLPTTNRKDRPA
jgi:ParB family chromosome partitioning protein